MRGVVPPSEVGLSAGTRTPASALDPAVAFRLETPGERLSLGTGWALQSSAALAGGPGGELLSSAAYDPVGWYPATVPGTVFGALVAGGVYPDPFFGMNLREVPGMGYPVGANFSNLPMPPDSPFAVPWWYRKQFVLPERDADGAGNRHFWLHLDGVNYRGAVWLNGTQVAGPDEVAGAMRTFSLDVTAVARPGSTNVLAIEVRAPTSEDLAITFVDWNPAPPDKSMGLWREVYLTTSGPAVVRHPAAITRLDPATGQARVTLTALVENATDRPVEATVTAGLRSLTAVHAGAVELAQPVILAARERREVAFTSEAFPALRIDPARLWWPAQMGSPELHELTFELHIEGSTGQRARALVGLREITSELTGEGHRVFLVNGKRLLVRGAGWAPDMLLRHSPARLADELGYVRDMGLNTLRLEGKMESEEFFALADRHGLLVMVGWCCGDRWERWSDWTTADHGIAGASQRSQLYRLRGHPSVLAWLNGSDHPPPREVEARYLAIAVECQWSNPILSSGTARATELGGETGLKMTGPYEYVVPSYWLTDDRRGGAHGFNTETSPGPAVPPLASLRRMLPEDQLWPVGEHWRFHAGGGPFADLGLFTEALAARYGAPRDLADFTLKAQLMAYEGIRAMFEAYSRNKYRATGVIQWMLNNAWPSVIWHLYDYYLRPAGGYFGAKKACQPLHPLYGHDDESIWLVNSRYHPSPGLTVTAAMYDLDGRERGSGIARVDAPADSAQRVLPLPAAIAGAGPVAFLRLAVADPEGRQVGSNFYWLSRTPDVLAWDRSSWYVTPTASFADFSALQHLPPTRLALRTRSERLGDDTITHVAVENAGPALAFFVRLELLAGAGGQEVLPVRWQDNYLSLLPGETRTIAARYRTRDLAGAQPVATARGWNVAP
jgi:exo-1,4-beta-D-glucosaminidase